MNLKVYKSQINGEIAVPGSKSHTIRAIAIASMAEGTSLIRSPLISADTLSCVEAAKALGAEISMEDILWTVKGTGGKIKNPGKVIDMGNSGTSLRIFSALAATADFEIGFDGDNSLRSRPMGQLLEAFGNLGVKHQSTNGKCPLSLTGPIRGGFTEVDGTSSQFLTALLFSTPLALGDSEIKVRNLNEVPYVEITLDWLHRQEINFDYTPNYDSFKVKGGQKYRPFNSVIPADFSTATFPLVAAAVCRGNVKIKNLDFSDRQGDKAVFNYLEQMGMKVKLHTEFTGVSCEETLKGMDLNLNSTPDALPAMAVTACFAEGTTKIHNVAQARIKETDRIACMTQELRKMGADITELEDGMIINGSKLHGAEVEGHDDHRIVMALAIAGMGAEGETKIKGAEAASVTYPDFIRDFTAMGANFTTEG